MNDRNQEFDRGRWRLENRQRRQSLKRQISRSRSRSRGRHRSLSPRSPRATREQPHGAPNLLLNPHTQHQPDPFIHTRRKSKRAKREQKWKYKSAKKVSRVVNERIRTMNLLGTPQSSSSNDSDDIEVRYHHSTTTEKGQIDNAKKPTSSSSTSPPKKKKGQADISMVGLTSAVAPPPPSSKGNLFPIDAFWKKKQLPRKIVHGFVHPSLCGGTKEFAETQALRELRGRRERLEKNQNERDRIQRRTENEVGPWAFQITDAKNGGFFLFLPLFQRSLRVQSYRQIVKNGKSSPSHLRFSAKKT